MGPWRIWYDSYRQSYGRHCKFFQLIFESKYLKKHPECAGNTIIEKVLDSKERRDAFKKLADTMKSGGALAIAQLSHVNISFTKVDMNKI